MNVEKIVFIIALAISLISGIIGSVYYNIKQNESMQSNIESAIVKGIDPIAVRCAWGRSDSVCMIYAANKK